VEPTADSGASKPTKIIVLDGAELARIVRESVRDALAEAMPKHTSAPAITGLQSRALAAKALGISTSTLDRLLAEPDGMPFVQIGKSRKIDIAAAREWLAKRGPKPTTRTAKKKADDVDVTSVLARGGLRAAGGAR
jgi:hypothetical protein